MAVACAAPSGVLSLGKRFSRFPGKLIYFLFLKQIAVQSVRGGRGLGRADEKAQGRQPEQATRRRGEGDGRLLAVTATASTALDSRVRAGARAMAAVSPRSKLSSRRRAPQAGFFFSEFEGLRF